MEISAYDQYVPDKELNTNFKIPRKRITDDSFGGSANYMHKTSNYDVNAIPAYSPESRSLDYDNTRGSTFQLRKFDCSIKLPAPQNTSSGSSNAFSMSGNKGMIEYPRMMGNFNNFNNSSYGSSNSGYFRQKSYLFSSNATAQSSKDLKQNQNTPLWARRGDSEAGQGPSEKPLGWNNPRYNNNFQDKSSVGNSDQGKFLEWNNYRGTAQDGSRNNDGGSRLNDYDNCAQNRSTHNWRDSRSETATTQGGYGMGNKFTPGPNSFGRYWKNPERPKIPKPNIPPVTIPDATDQTLPKELREMFQPLFCKLCSIQMTSNVMAKLHYVSKNHEKKIVKYLIEYAEKTGETLHPRAVMTASEKKEKTVDTDPRNFYCELCDLHLTGKQHADSHYMGKSHNAVRMGKKRPAGQGYYDSSGKWTRSKKEEKLMLVDGEDNFGMDFKRQKVEEVDPAPVANLAVSKPAIKSPLQFSCSLCIVSCVSEEQLNVHLNGSKHKKKLRLKGISPENFTLADESDVQEDDNSAQKNTNAVTDGDDSLRSKYITPNGFYYCQKCNITVNSESQFKQHLASKNHAKKVKKTE